MSIIFPVLQNSEDTTEIRKAILSIIDEIKNKNTTSQISDNHNLNIQNLTTRHVEYDLLGSMSVVNGVYQLDMAGPDMLFLSAVASTSVDIVNIRMTTIRLIVQHNNTTEYTLTFNSVHSIGTTGASNKAFTLASGDTKFTVFDIFSDGTKVFVLQGKFYA